MSSQLQVSGEAKIRAIQGPVVANSGVITALNGGASQYVRGDGTLADFPTSTGGGSSVSYYLNSSVSQGTIGGVAYRQLSKTPISGAGTDIAASTNGYIASYITDANDPSLLEVPAGNFNCEFYFSVNSNAHNPYVYAELYKYDGTTFTLLGSNVAIPEYLTNGTTLSAYYFAIPVAVAALTVTDRIAIRIYVNVDGRIVTLHTENNHLCQVVTTFSKGLISLNNLTRQNQFFGTGTSGTDFAISSSTATHTFNLPVASATNTGKLSSTDWSTFNGKQPAGNYVTLDTTQTITAAKTFTENPIINGAGTNSAYTILQSAGTNKWRIGNNYAAGVNTFDIFAYDNTTTPLSINSNGAMTLTANVTTTGAQFVQNGFYLSNANGGALAGYTLMFGADDGIYFALRNLTGGARFIFPSAASYNYTFPAVAGTIALTSNLSDYLPLAGGTLTGALSGTSATFSGNVNISSASTNGFVVNSTNNASYRGFTIQVNGTTQGGMEILPNTGEIRIGGYSTTSDYFPVIYSDGVAALTFGIGASPTATFSSSVTATSSSFPLDIYGTTNNYGLRINNVQAATLFLYSSNANADNRNWGLFTNSEVFGDFDIRQSNAINGDLTSGANSTSRFYIKNNGNVGIGTTSPATKLDVNGTTKSTNYITINNTASIAALTTATVLTLSTSEVGVYIIQANFGAQGNAVYGSTLIVVANAGSFRVVTNGSGANAALTLSGANVQITNALGSALDATASAILIAN